MDETSSPCAAQGYNGTYLNLGMDAMGFDVTPSGTMSMADLGEALCHGGPNVFVMAGFGGDPNVSGDGHEIVIYGADDVLYALCPCYVYYMDPYSGSLETALYEELQGGLDGYGAWEDCITVKAYKPPTGIGDICSFAAEQIGSYVDLTFSIYDTADPQEKAAIYIADNTWGPARLISALVDTVLLLPEGNDWHDIWRNNTYDSDYYYYLDHDYEPFDSVRAPDSGLRDYRQNPVHFVRGEPRPHFSFPEDLLVEDVPHDFGTALRLSWVVPACDSIVDCYNIYRRDSLELAGGFTYLGSVDHGTTEFIDREVNTHYYYRYIVSTAHHGLPGEVPPGCFGIWNDFSEPSLGETTPIQNIAYIDLVPLPDSSLSLRLCPQGDWDTLGVTIQVRGADSTYTAGIPRNSIYLTPSYNTTVFCDQDTMFAENDTDSLGTSEIFCSNMSACDSITLWCRVKGMRSRNALRVAARSPDLQLDMKVDVSDLPVFGGSYGKCQGQQGFSPCCDFNYDGCCNLMDYAFLGTHYGHACPGLEYVMNSQQNPMSSPSLRFVIDKAEDFETTRRFYATVYMAHTKPSAALCLGLDFEIPGKLISFLPLGSEGLQVAAAEVTNEGRKILFISAWGDGALRESEIELGTLEAVVSDKGKLDPSRSPFRLIFGDVLGADGVVGTINSSSVQNADEINSEFATEVRQNYPNPFNPSTTIEYSIDANMHVSLTIYNIIGQRIRTLVDEHQTKNEYRVTWDGMDDKGARVQNGVYFCRLNAGTHQKTTKILVVR